MKKIILLLVVTLRSLASYAACTPTILVPSITSSNTSSSALVIFNMNVTGGSPASYAWDFTNDGSTDAAVAYPSHPYANGTYTVKLTVYDGCGTAYSTTQSLTVSSGACTPVTYVPSITSSNTSSNSTILITSSVSGGSPAAYDWDLNNDGITDFTLQNPTHTFTNGTHLIKLTVYDYCGNAYSTTQNLTVSVATNIDNANGSIASTKLYPNPSDGNVLLELSLRNNSNVKVTVSDLMGKQVMTVVESAFSDLNTSFDVSTLNKGIYSVNYTVNGISAKSELLIVR